MTGTYVHPDILSLLFSLFSFIPSATLEENSMGTVPFALRFFKLSLVINVLYSTFCLIIGYTLLPRLLQMPAVSLWPIIFCDMVIQCYQEPEMPRGLCCLPVQVKSKWYPLILVAIFTVFFGPQLSLFAGIGVGYLYVFGFLKWTESSAPSLRNWENSWPFKSFKNHPSFRANTSALQNSPAQSGGFFSNFMGRNQAAAESRPAQREEKKESNFKAFGGKGAKLGSDLPRSEVAKKMDQARAASENSFKYGGSAVSTSPASTSAASDLEKDGQRPNRNLANLSALVNKKPEAPKDENVVQLDSVESEGNEEETSRLNNGKKADDSLGDYKPVNMNQTSYSME